MHDDFHRMTALAFPRSRSGYLRALALLAFIALLVFGPLSENTTDEKIFALALVLLGLLAALFATARVAFPLLLASLLFGSIELAGRLKFLYLQTPLLAPDLQYFVNEGTIEVITHYPLLLGVSIGAIVLVPLLLVLSFIGEKPALLRERPRALRTAARLLGTLAALVLLAVCMIPRGPFSAMFNKPMWIAINDKSFITDFFTSFNDTVITEPVSPADVDRSIVWKLSRPMQAPPVRPDVVMILAANEIPVSIAKWFSAWPPHEL